jgi:hypothetical protein
MKEFVYPVESVFSQNALLGELKASNYFIASYQRGYKWKSFGKNDQVPLLLTDTYEAFKDGNEEYFLQYITIKKNIDFPNYLEVIDGQQRLTTISLFFYVAHLMGLDDCNITEGKVLFERHGLDKNIFETILKIQDETDVRLFREQDVYYLYHAVSRIKKFFNLLLDGMSIDARHVENYVQYFKSKVKIIINLEESITSPEEVFSNLNDNKVELTDEFLIKGLLFTKSTREKEGIRTFNEIQDLRSRIAYKWDEIDNWFSQPAHVDFFNVKNSKGNSGIGIILNLLCPIDANENLNDLIKKFFITLETQERKDNIDHTHDLFNAYNDSLNSWSKVNAKLTEIINLSKRLKNWYYDNETHALLGYFILTKGNIQTIINLSTSNLKKHLYQHTYQSCLIKNNSIEGLNYSSDLQKLNKIFYALNIFRLKKEGNNLIIDNNRRFDFSSFKKNWTLEHIYPQNPKLKVAQDLIDFKPWFEKHLNKLLENPSSRLEGEKLLKLLNTQDLEILSPALESFNKVFEVINIDVHEIGNLALLTQGDNSSVSNHIFPHKRRIILDRINAGSFVPQHTIEAITKYLHPIDFAGDTKESFDEDLWDWSTKDCSTNAQWIKITYNQLLHVLEIKKEENYEIGQL